MGAGTMGPGSTGTWLVREMKAGTTGCADLLLHAGHVDADHALEHAVRRVVGLEPTGCLRLGEQPLDGDLTRRWPGVGRAPP